MWASSFLWFRWGLSSGFRVLQPGPGPKLRSKWRWPFQRRFPRVNGASTDKSKWQNRALDGCSWTQRKMKPWVACHFTSEKGLSQGGWILDAVCTAVEWDFLNPPRAEDEEELGWRHSWKFLGVGGVVDQPFNTLHLLLEFLLDFFFVSFFSFVCFYWLQRNTRICKIQRGKS